MRLGNTFSAREVALLKHVMDTLLRGGIPDVAVRNPAFASLYRKVVAMQKRIDEAKASQAGTGAKEG